MLFFSSGMEDEDELVENEAEDEEGEEEDDDDDKDEEEDDTDVRCFFSLMLRYLLEDEENGLSE